MKKITKYLATGLITCLTITGSAYTYAHFKLQQAYNNKNYTSVYKQIQILRHFSNYAIDIGIKSTVEHSIYTLQKKSKEQFINPANSLICHSLIKNAQITSSPHNAEWQSFYEHYMNFIVNLPFNDTTRYLENNTYIYTPFIDITKQLEFREKNTYIDSCYGYPITFHLQNISLIIKDSIRYNSQMSKNKKTTISHSLSLIKKQIELIDSIPNKPISNLYYNNLQHTFLTNINEPPTGQAPGYLIRSLTMLTV